MRPSTRRSAIASRLARQERRPCRRSRCRRPTSAPSSLRRSSGPRRAARTATNEATGGEANAGTGGVANADASGGSVTVGDVAGDDANIAIDASGGTAYADASGGDNNVAVAGGGQTGDAAAQAVELSTLTLTLEGNVAPGKLATYWVDTDAGRRPAQGPALVQVEDAPADTGAIIAEARTCPIAEPQPGYDWFGQCTAPAADMQFTPVAGEWRRLAAGVAGDQRAGTGPLRRARGGDLPAAAGGDDLVLRGERPRRRQRQHPGRGRAGVTRLELRLRRPERELRSSQCGTAARTVHSGPNRSGRAEREPRIPP